MSKRIMIICENNSYLVTSLRDRLQASDFSVNLIGADVNEISKTIKETEGVIIFGDEQILEKRAALNYLKDRLMDDCQALLFVSGSESEIEEIGNIVTKGLIALEFLRPIKVNECVTEIEKALELSARMQKKKILVVDDSGAMLRNVKAWLEDKYQVILASSGAMAIKYLTLNKPDLILLDYEMPVVDGSQVMEMIRGEADFAHIPVIFLTSKGDKESVMKVMSLKPEGYLLKTLPPAEIVKSVDEFFIRQKANLI